MVNSLFLFLVISLSCVCHAKIADPPGVYFKGRLFCSNGNTVFAVKSSDKNFRCNMFSPDSKLSHKIWETQLPFSTEPESYNPDLERDVQWCIVRALSIEGSEIVASDCNGKKYRLIQKNGKLKKT